MDGIGKLLAVLCVAAYAWPLNHGRPEAAERLITQAAASAPVAATATKAKPKHTFTGKVVKVVDGDTVCVETAQETRKVRLDKIDAPEAAQPWGQEAAAAARTFLLNMQVTVRWEKRDRYGRYLGTLTVPDDAGNLVNVASWLVQQGHAWVYLAYSQDPELLKLQAEAQAAKRGLWGQADAKAPWEFRREQRARPKPPRKAPGGLPGRLRPRPLAPLLRLRR